MSIGQRSIAAFTIVVAFLGGCGKASSVAAEPRSPELLTVRVVRAFPHDRTAFTQGLLLHEGKLYESTGISGSSSLRQVDPESGAIERQVAIEGALFGEGLARVGAKLVQLTWQDGRALVWNLATFKKEREHSYQGEGWGLCFDGKQLIMSDGSAKLTFRDPETFEKRGEVSVRRAGQAQGFLNELECDKGLVYANVWQESHIARIDPRSGEVTGWIDASGLLTAEERSSADVLNGIAFWPERGTFVLTGKLWPRTFEVELVPVRAVNTK